MINYSGMTREKIHKVLRRRLQDLREEPDDRFIHFDIAAGMSALNVTVYRDQGLVIRKTRGNGAVMLLAATKQQTLN